MVISLPSIDMSQFSGTKIVELFPVSVVTSQELQSISVINDQTSDHWLKFPSKYMLLLASNKSSHIQFDRRLKNDV